MNNTRAWIVLGLALLAGLVAVVLAARWMTGRSGETAQIVVAARDVDLGAVLDATALSTIAWPGAVQPEGAFRTTKDVEGRVVKAAVTRGEPVLESRLAPLGSKGGLSAVISPGKRAITVRVNEIVGVAGFALPGSHVDVMVHTSVDNVRQSGQATPVSKIVLERILILAVAQEAGRDETKPKVVNAVTLEVTPKEAELLDVARSVGTLSLVLRNQIDPAAPNSAAIAASGVVKADLFPTPPAPPPAARVAAASRPASAPSPSPKPARPNVEVIRGVSRSVVEL